MDPREERLIRNEALFRSVNERLREVGESFSLVTDRTPFVCECSDVACTERIELTLEEYEAVRSLPGHFLLLAGHDIEGLDEVVEPRGGWVLARKARQALREADVEVDPRRGD